ncbi:MAG: thiamine biosynthesis protein ThiS [Herminiimonas sp.]|jgi:molybdopterin synthase sulfur carrier subunit|nr:thiamine biosynthesis protein ThiS [Herminiimonas sp.]
MHRYIIFHMPKVVFTQQLRRFTETPEIDTGAGLLRDALEAAFTANPRLRGYILDDQGHLRENVVIFIDGQRVRDRVGLNDALGINSSIHVLQALSGG